MLDKNNDDLQKELKNLKQDLKTMALLRSELDFFKHLFETLANPIFIKDNTGKYIHCNKAFERFTGKNKNQIIGKTVYDMGPKEIADKYHKMDQQLLEQGGIQQYEWKVKNRDGEIRDVIFDKALFYNNDRSIGGIIGIISDITNHIRTESALKISEKRFKKISALANDAIIQMNDYGKITYWNEAAGKIFGYTWEEVKGKDLHEILVPEKYLSMFKKGFKKFKIGGQGPAIGKTLELSALRKDGTEFQVELSLSSYQENGKWQSVGIVRDISERKMAEKERDQLIENLKSALGEIQTLKGIVPICASCKKIRDDKGFWNHLETYIQEHSQAEFSHGICPDCQKKLYPEFSQK